MDLDETGKRWDKGKDFFLFCSCTANTAEQMNVSFRWKGLKPNLGKSKSEKRDVKLLNV